MPTDSRRSDLRIIKTEKVLNAALFALLERNNFGKITVRDICEEALISRATFYARFADKYDFLKSWLINLKLDGIEFNENNEKTEKIINDFIYENKTVIKNIICDADNETLGILSEFVLSVLSLPDKYDIRQLNPGQNVIYNFYAGGLIYYFQWLAKSKFLSEINPINTYLLEITKKFREWVRDAI